MKNTFENNAEKLAAATSAAIIAFNLPATPEIVESTNAAFLECIRQSFEMEGKQFDPIVDEIPLEYILSAFNFLAYINHEVDKVVDRIMSNN